MSKKRSYLSDEKDLSFNFESDLPEQSNINDIFHELCRRLSSKYDIDKGVFIIRSYISGKFTAVSTWNDGTCRSNISINLSSEPSLTEKVAEHGVTYTDCVGGEFSGNFFERRLLLGDNAQSYMLHPLKYAGRVVGMLGYSSETQTAFTTFEEGVFDKVANQLGEIIWKKNPKTKF
jgi:hypothetical protein